MNNAVGFVIVLSKIKCGSNKKKHESEGEKKKVLLFSKAESSHSVLMQLKPLILPAAFAFVCVGKQSQEQKV